MVILVHGLSSTKDHPHVVGLAECIRARSLDVLSYDARGHGESGGLCTLGDLERNDVAAAVAHARRSHTRVALVGASMGAIAAMAYAATDPDIGGSCRGFESSRLANPVSTPRARYVHSGPNQTGSVRSLNAIPMCGSIQNGIRLSHPAPWRREWSALFLSAIVHGRNDHLIPFHFSLGISSTEMPEAHAVVVPGMGHAFDPVGHRVAFAMRLIGPSTTRASREVTVSDD